MLRVFTVARDRYMKQKHKEVSYEKWLKTASPFLIPKKKQPEVVLSKKGNPLTKNQIRAKNKLAKKKRRKGDRKLFWKSQHPNTKKAKKVMPKYAVYILSKEWRVRCALFYKTHGHFCVACGETKNIHMHHMTYRHLGNEMDEELAPLCRDCHHEYHELYGVSNDMVETTVAFIEEKKQLI
jgi:hypothetical protein